MRASWGCEQGGGAQPGPHPPDSHSLLPLSPEPASGLPSGRFWVPRPGWPILQTRGRRKGRTDGLEAAGSGTRLCLEPWGTDPCSGSRVASGIPRSPQEKLLGESGPERMGQEGSRGLRGRKPQLPGHPAFIHSLIHSLIHPLSRHPLVQTDICVHITQMRSLICSCVPGGTRLEALKHRPLGGKLRGQVARTAQLGAHVPQGWTQSHSGEWRPWEGPSEASVLQTHISDFHRMNTEVTRGLHHEGGNI